VFGMSTEGLVQAAILILIFLGVAFPFHEFAHAWAAYRLGDGTAKMYGRLSLNPVVHFDPFGGLLLAITALSNSGFLLGWAKPTPVNPSNLRDRRNGEVLVALAGPASNLLMAVAGAIVWRILEAVGVIDLTTLEASGPMFILVSVLHSFVVINIVLAVFNMIPVPPLDGSAILFRVVSPATAWQIRPMLAQYGSILLLVIIFAFVLTPLGRGLSQLINGITNLLLGL
jgi:Zn-dependent protease